MSENKHTPEPWQVFEDDPRAIVTKENPMLSLLSVGEDGLAIMYEEADARRITACVNACEDILDYELSLGCVARLSDQLRTITKQRDELLAALEHFATWARGQHKAQSKGCHATFNMMMLRNEIDFAEAAIASVMGEQ